MSNTQKRHGQVEAVRPCLKPGRKLKDRGKRAAKRRAEAVAEGMEKRAQIGGGVTL